MGDLFEVHHRIIGEELQQKISQSKIVVVGIGGLGCAVAQGLSRLGVGHLVLVDHDKVNRTNLPRQTLFTDLDIGKFKAEIAREKLAGFSSSAKIESVISPFSSATNHLFDGADIVMDCTDNFATSVRISRAAEQVNIPTVYGGVDGFDGQVGVFGYQNSFHFYRVFPNHQALLQAENCEASGVLPFVVQLAGNFQVAEAFKILAQKENVLSGQMLCMNFITHKQRILRLKEIKN